MNAYQFFGIPLDNIRAAEAHQATACLKPRNVRVPTRTDVATMSPLQLRDVLHDWMDDSAIEIIPSRMQMIEVLGVLCSRPDFGDLQEVAQMCTNYVLSNRRSTLHFI